MKEFRQENFLQFVRKVKLSFSQTWVPNISFLVFMTILVLVNKPNDFIDYFIISFFIVLFILVRILSYYFIFAIYSVGGKAIRDLGSMESVIFKDIDVYFKGCQKHDESYLTIITHTTRYDFLKADIVLAGSSMILMGKGKTFEIDFAYPIELTFGSGYTRLQKAKIIDWANVGAHIEIQFKDPNYKENFKIYIKNSTEIEKLWLTSVWLNGG
jgi:hypothetical protein